MWYRVKVTSPNWTKGGKLVPRWVIPTDANGLFTTGSYCRSNVRMTLEDATWWLPILVRNWPMFNFEIVEER